MLQLDRMKTALPRKAGSRRKGVTMTSRFGRDVKAVAAASEDYTPFAAYPRPQMVRKGPSASWQILNGWWEYAIMSSTMRPARFDGRILVPFSPEAPLSGVDRQLMPGEHLWYRRRITVSEDDLSGRLLLHFGAVDQRCIIYLNGEEIGRHSGGYLPFTLEMTGHVRPGENILELNVTDYSEKAYFSRGKQKLARGGMFYTAQSGIWQTVWMERVPKTFVKYVKITPDPRGNALELQVFMDGPQATRVRAFLYQPVLCGEAPVLDGDERFIPEDASVLHGEGEVLRKSARNYDGQSGAPLRLRLRVPKGKKWTPRTPWLYPVRIEAGEDSLYSYSALRTVGVMKDEMGTLRFSLNRQPCFMNGVLDQGYWPESLMTPPSDEALLFDISQMKKLGFNMIRKHCKLEAERFYYYCDMLGMFVWQDMVNGGRDYDLNRLCYLPTLSPELFAKRGDTSALDFARTGRQDARGRRQWIRETKAAIHALYDHPCIVLWVLFNEGWGQFESVENAAMVRGLDPTRLIDAASGWFDQGAGDVRSVHNYFRKLEVVPDDHRVFALTEYGGYSLPFKGHSWNEEVYGYGMMEDETQLRVRFRKTAERIRDLEKEGLAAAVYTQVSDIEDECNGLMTYDREKVKIR